MHDNTSAIISKIKSIEIDESGEWGNVSRQKPMNVLNYITMSLILQIRDLVCPPKKVLSEVEITPGICVLDFGCGIGSYSIETAELLARSGKVFALDIHPLAIEDVSKTALKKKLTNLETILSDCETKLPSNSVDIILLYYVFNDLKNPDKVLRELHRVIKPQGILSFSEFRVEKISPGIAKTGLFQLQCKGNRTHTFMKMQ
ncbi:MAG: class I SAM-dependent methyltransferase [Nitrosopumilaceae archaeon]